MRKLKVGDKVRWKHESMVRTLVAPCPDYSDSWYISTAYSSCSEKYLTLVEPPLKFKAGDKVCVIANTNHHQYEIGQTIELEQLRVEASDGIERWLSSTLENGEKWFVSVEDIEPIEADLSKFKSGDKVRVVANNSSHEFAIGEIIRLEKNEDEGTVSKWKGFSLTNEEEKWYLNDNDIEPIKDRTVFMVGDKFEITEDKDPLNHVTTRVLDVALRACGIGLPYEIIDKVIDLVELIQTTEGETTIKDIAELQAEWEK